MFSSYLHLGIITFRMNANANLHTIMVKSEIALFSNQNILTLSQEDKMTKMSLCLCTIGNKNVNDIVLAKVTQSHPEFEFVFCFFSSFIIAITITSSHFLIFYSTSN